MGTGYKDKARVKARAERKGGEGRKGEKKIDSIKIAKRGGTRKENNKCEGDIPFIRVTECSQLDPHSGVSRRHIERMANVYKPAPSALTLTNEPINCILVVPPRRTVSRDEPAAFALCVLNPSTRRGRHEAPSAASFAFKGSGRRCNRRKRGRRGRGRRVCCVGDGGAFRRRRRGRLRRLTEHQRGGEPGRSTRETHEPGCWPRRRGRRSRYCGRRRRRRW